MIDDRLAPWTSRQVLVAMAVQGLLVALIALAHSRAVATTTLSGQTSWISLSVLALCTSLSCHGALVLAGRRAIGQRRTRLLPLTAGLPRTDLGSGPLLRVAGGTHVHHQDCLMLSGREGVELIEASRAEREGLRVCEVCR